MADLNGDGKADLAISNGYGNGNTGNGTFAAEQLDLPGVLPEGAPAPAAPDILAEAEGAPAPAEDLPAVAAPATRQLKLPW